MLNFLRTNYLRLEIDEFFFQGTNIYFDDNMGNIKWIANEIQERSDNFNLQAWDFLSIKRKDSYFIFCSTSFIL